MKLKKILCWIYKNSRNIF